MSLLQCRCLTGTEAPHQYCFWTACRTFSLTRVIMTTHSLRAAAAGCWQQMQSLLNLITLSSTGDARQICARLCQFQLQGSQCFQLGMATNSAQVSMGHSLQVASWQVCAAAHGRGKLRGSSTLHGASKWRKFSERCHGTGRYALPDKLRSGCCIQLSCLQVGRPQTNSACWPSNSSAVGIATGLFRW